MTVLHQMIVDTALYLERMGVGQLIRRYNPRAERAEGIQRFPPHPLTITELQVSGSYIIGTGVSENGAQGIFFRNPALIGLGSSYHIDYAGTMLQKRLFSALYRPFRPPKARYEE